MDQPEMISGPPTLSRLWCGVTSPSLAASIALERSLWINQLHHPCVQKTSVFAYLVMKFAGPAQDNCGRAICLPSQKARSALVYLTSTDLDSVEEGAPAKRGRDHRRGPKEAAGTFIKGVLRCLFMGEWHQKPRYRELPKGRTTFGSGCLGYFNCLRVYESLKIDEVRAMRQHFPMNLRGGCGLRRLHPRL